MDKTASAMTTWLNLLSVASGGAVGSVARYLITLGSAALPGGSTPLGTTIANLIGCAAIGALAQYTVLVQHVPPRMILAVQVGFLGSLTTFSTFALDSTVMASSGKWGLSGVYVLANLVLGWTALVLSGAVVKGWMT
ncbi:MAG: CrcB family protein [Planctomycetota bacterium]